MSAKMSSGAKKQSDDKQSDDKEHLQKKVKKAIGRKHKVKWSFVIYLLLLLACVGAAIYVIEYFQ